MTIPRDDPLKRRPERGPLPARGVRQQKLVEGQSVGDHEDAADPHDVYILHSEFVAAEGDMRKVAAGTYTLHKSNLNAEAAPTADDDASAGYSIGSRWIYGTSVYVCTSAGVGNANWEDLTSAGATDGDAIHDNVAGEIAAITEKASPVAADLIVIEDSAAANVKKRVQLGNLPGGGSGDVVGPASATDTAIALYDGITGKLIKNSVVLCDASGNITGVLSITGPAGGSTITGGTGLGDDLTLIPTSHATKGDLLVDNVDVFKVVHEAAASAKFQVQRDGLAEPSFTMQAGATAGVMKFGSGAITPDAGIQHNGANKLRADVTELLVYPGIGAGLALDYVAGGTGTLTLTPHATQGASRAISFPDASGELALDSELHAAATAADAGHTIAAQAITSVAASATVVGHVELATVAETDTGTDATRAVTPDGLAGSNYGERTIGVLVSDPNGDAITTGDGKAYARIPSTMNGWNLIEVAASLSTVSSSGIPTVQIRRSRWASATTRTNADMLSTKLTIDASEFDSVDAAAAAVIDTANDDVNTGDHIYIDIDVAGTGAKGLFVVLTFRLP